MCCDGQYIFLKRYPSLIQCITKPGHESKKFLTFSLILNWCVYLQAWHINAITVLQMFYQNAGKLHQSNTKSSSIWIMQVKWTESFVLRCFIHSQHCTLVQHWTNIHNCLGCMSYITFNFCPVSRVIMMTSSNGNIFRITGPLCGEFTGLRWIPRTKASDAELWCFLWSASE